MLKKFLTNIPNFPIRTKKNTNAIVNYTLKSMPILENEYKVTPALHVPPHIKRPEWVNSPNPIYGIYEGIPKIHDKQTLKKLRAAGNLAGRTAEHALLNLKTGMTTDDIDKIVHEFIIKNDAYPTPIGFMGFPKSVCTTVNEVVCHGIPNLRPLVKGDFINIDITLYKDGVHGDTSVMGYIEHVDEEIKQLINVTQLMLYEAIKICRPGEKISRIGRICGEIAENYGYSICDLFSGHGIGNLLHMPPMVNHVDNICTDIMIPGLAFTIEPIVLMNKPQNYFLWKDSFTIIPIPKIPSAQWEHTIIITENGHEVITKRSNENFE